MAHQKVYKVIAETVFQIICAQGAIKICITLKGKVKSGPLRNDFTFGEISVLELEKWVTLNVQASGVVIFAIAEFKNC